MKNMITLNKVKVEVYVGLVVVIIVAYLVVAGVLNKDKIDFKNRFIFACQDNKVITAIFADEENKVRLQLTDGRDFSIDRVESASGEKFSNGDDSFVFWTKGDEAFITEGLQHDKTYIDCVVQTPPNLDSQK